MSKNSIVVCGIRFFRDAGFPDYKTYVWAEIRRGYLTRAARDTTAGRKRLARKLREAARWVERGR